ncbi:MAG: hypothetical protein KGS72_19665 [Cyanobacteria bacterium REEB67]|nr:hypothetical protein [Cyanobacteria bacterium REEB67]
MIKFLNVHFRSFLSRAKSQDAPPDSKPTDSFGEKLLRYIPGDIVAAWVALTGILAQAAADVPVWLSWAVLGALLALTPFYVCFVKTDPPGITAAKSFHWVTACLAFVSWSFAMGGPFATLAWYKPVFGSVLLVIVTLVIPVLERFFVKGPIAPSGTAGSGGTNSGGSATPPAP